MAPDDLVVMGRASGAFGLRGELRAYPLTADPALFTRAGRFFVGPNPQQTRRLTLLAMRGQGKRLLLSTKEINSKEEADQLKGNWLYLRRSDLPDLEDGEYYWFELKGARVETVGGEPLGTVTGLMDIGPHDVLEVTGPDGREILIPVIDPVVVELNPAEGRVVVDPPEGLIEAQVGEGDEKRAKGAKGAKGAGKKRGGQKGAQAKNGAEAESEPE